ncbi:MAG: SLC13 family permease [Planctomycetota bacterium]|nr:SLC13 family permease [Planctomycetota bacterium]
MPSLLAAGAHTVPGHVTAIFCALLVLLILALALEEKLHAKKSIIAGAFASVCLLLGAAFHILPFQDVLIGAVSVPVPEGLLLEPGQWLVEGGHALVMPVYIPAVDWGVIAIILGSSLFVDVTSKSGLFTWIAIRLTKLSGGDPRKLLWLYGLMTVVFSAVLNNVTAMIIVGSLSAVSLSRLKRSGLLLGFLLTEGLLTNVGGLLTLISSVPNIIVGQKAGISFLKFFIVASPFVVVTTVVTLLMGAQLFKVPRLVGEAERAEAASLVAGFDENDGIESRGFFVFGAVMLGLFIVVIAMASVLPWVSSLGLGYVALAFALIMLLRFKSSADRFYQAVDWDLLGFFCALFAVIYVMEYAQVLHLIGRGVSVLLGLGEHGGTASLLVSAAGFSSVTDNIPLAAMMANILEAQSVMAPESVTSGSWWAVIFGANLGGNLTPIGSASTLVAVTVMHKHQVPLSFGGFVVKALPFALAHLAIAVVYVLLVVPLLA